jgi:phosphopantothenoylcysteine decarboxylase
MAGKAEKCDTLAGYEVLLCLGGGIACYKVADLASKLVQAGAGVTVAMTEAAKEFIAPLTFQSLTGRAVFMSMWQSTEYYDTRHISLTDRADIMVVAPATANLLAKLSLGIADDLVSTMALAATGACPVLLAPAMNTRMWEAPQVAENVARLRKFGAQFVGPDTGRLACGTTGPGRMSEPAEILARISEIILAKPPKRVK